MQPALKRWLAALLVLAGLLAAALACSWREEVQAGEGDVKASTNAIGMKLVLVPAGKFTMGSPVTEAERDDDEAQHPVEITKPYYMSACLVTQEQYAKVMGKNPSWMSSSGPARQKV